MNSLMRANGNFPSLIENFRVGGPISRDMNDFFNTGMFAVSNVPAVNVIEHNDGFRIEVAAPGLKKEDFKLQLNHNNLIISAYQENRKEDKSSENEKYTRREFSYSSFRRTCILPSSVNADSIQASYADGVLKIEIPKREEARVKPSRQIEISG